MEKDRFQELIKYIEKEVPGSKLLFGNDPFLQVKRLPFDIDVLDRILGGGLPFGRLSLITGDSAVGKTLLAQFAVRSAQKRDLASGFVDTERTFDPEWWQKTGVDLQKVLVCQPSSGEEALDVVISMVRQGIELVVLDSVAALIPTAEIEQSTQEFLIGAQARLFNKGLRKITQANKEGHSIFVAINQTRVGIGPVGVPLEDALPAGRGQRFFATLEIKLSRGGYIKDENKRRIGLTIRCRTVKNKVFTPMLECDLPFRWDEGAIDTLAGLLEIALDLDIIRKTGAIYRFGEEQFRGKLHVIDALKENPSLFQRLKEAIESAEV
jgi:recombination protein RecA